MAKFFGKVGFGVAEAQTVEVDEEEVKTGIWTDEITEREYYGDIIRDTRRMDQNESVLGELTVSHSISIVADDYAISNFSNIKYVRWSGVPWTVPSVEVHSPRLILNLGGVYNGPTS